MRTERCWKSVRQCWCWCKHQQQNNPRACTERASKPANERAPDCELVSEWVSERLDVYDGKRNSQHMHTIYLSNVSFRLKRQWAASLHVLWIDSWIGRPFTALHRAYFSKWQKSMPYLMVPLSFRRKSIGALFGALAISLILRYAHIYVHPNASIQQFRFGAAFGRTRVALQFFIIAMLAIRRIFYFSIQWIANAMINQVRMYRSSAEFSKFSCKSHLALVMIIFRMRCQSDRFLSRSHPTFADVFNDYFFFFLKNLEYYVATLLSSFRQIKMFQVYGMIAVFKQVFASIESYRLSAFLSFVYIQLEWNLFRIDRLNNNWKNRMTVFNETNRFDFRIHHIWTSVSELVFSFVHNMHCH